MAQGGGLLAASGVCPVYLPRRRNRCLRTGHSGPRPPPSLRPRNPGVRNEQLLVVSREKEHVLLFFSFRDWDVSVTGDGGEARLGFETEILLKVTEQCGQRSINLVRGTPEPPRAEPCMWGRNGLILLQAPHVSGYTRGASDTNLKHDSRPCLDRARRPA